MLSFYFFNHSFNNNFSGFLLKNHKVVGLGNKQTGEMYFLCRYYIPHFQEQDFAP